MVRRVVTLEACDEALKQACEEKRAGIMSAKAGDALLNKLIAMRGGGGSEKSRRWDKDKCRWYVHISYFDRVDTGNPSPLRLKLSSVVVGGVDEDIHTCKY